LRFIELLEALSEKGDSDRVEDYLTLTVLSLSFKGYDADTVLEMDVDDVIRELVTPVKPYGWSTVWGKHIVARDN